MMHPPSDPQLPDLIFDARERTLDLVVDLKDSELFGPRLPIVNPLHWEIGHVAWFQERWVLRHALGEPALLAGGGDELYDSSVVPHDDRWDLPLPSRSDTVGYLHEVRRRVLLRLKEGALRDRERYFVWLSIFHEDMHDEAFLYTRQTLGYPKARPWDDSGPAHNPGPLLGGGPCRGDVSIPGGEFVLGSAPGTCFVFDNEKWEHRARVEPFSIARAPVTQSEFAAFVDARGYEEPKWWSPEGWAELERTNSRQPMHWRRSPSGFERVDFDRLVPLEPHRPVLHVSWHEARAYCAWAGRRLPTELEWEVAATGEPVAGGNRLSPNKRRYPWGSDPPTSARANLDGLRQGCLDVGALPDGDSAFGARQLLGNVWEWTASDFLPYPGFSADPYRDYSLPWFSTHKVLRGGCWVTRGRLIRPTYRNFYRPDRRDVWAGFRTCAIDSGT